MTARSRLVRASQLPSTFAIQTTWHEPATAHAVRMGKRVLVSIMGASVVLRLSQRVRVLRDEAQS